jgi:hypothetical protein
VPGGIEIRGDAGSRIVYGDAAPVIATDALEAVIVVASESWITVRPGLGLDFAVETEVQAMVAS